MNILIVKDAATKIPREVKDMADVRAIEAQGFTVEVLDDTPAFQAAVDAAESAAPVAAKKAAKPKKG